MMWDGSFYENEEEKEINELRVKIEAQYSSMSNPTMSKEYYISSSLAEYYRNKSAISSSHSNHDKFVMTSDAIVYIDRYYDVMYKLCYSSHVPTFYNNILEHIEYNFGTCLDAKIIKSKLSKYNVRNYNKLYDLFVSIILFMCLIFGIILFAVDSILISGISAIMLCILLMLCVPISDTASKFFSTPKKPSSIWD